MRTKSETVRSFDLERLGLLPLEWDRQISQLVDRFGMCTLLEGRSVTSREPEDSIPAEVCVVTGEVIFEHLRWLYSLYRGDLALLASQFAEREVTSASDLQSSVNINLLRGLNARYERHVDSNPVTGILFVNTLRMEDGGELIFEAEEGDLTIRPKAGLFIAFDARKITHYVAPLRNELDRISVPMNYYFSDELQVRPEDLDAYLYEPIVKKQN